MKDNIMDEATTEAIKKLITGMVSKEETSEFVYDEKTGKMKLIKQKIKKNNIPPNIDIIKLIYSQLAKDDDYNKYSTEQLQEEKQKLINQLKEEKEGESDS